ncbi:hypothetical protein CC2G_002218 [Coprinopsis cinerea AmutBmut pab1-1]|nr:hypothetical protein CC2G_002218 [Coprinopsis cinerea AmutBmut pab1-1]
MLSQFARRRCSPYMTNSAPVEPSASAEVPTVPLPETTPATPPVGSPSASVSRPVSSPSVSRPGSGVSGSQSGAGPEPSDEPDSAFSIALGSGHYAAAAIAGLAAIAL